MSATYCRSDLVTLGAAFAGGSAFFLSARTGAGNRIASARHSR